MTPNTPQAHKYLTPSTGKKLGTLPRTTSLSLQAQYQAQERTRTLPKATSLSLQAQAHNSTQKNSTQDLSKGTRLQAHNSTPQKNLPTKTYLSLQSQAHDPRRTTTYSTHDNLPEMCFSGTSERVTAGRRAASEGPFSFTAYILMVRARPEGKPRTVKKGVLLVTLDCEGEGGREGVSWGV